LPTTSRAMRLADTLYYPTTLPIRRFPLSQYR
jgi:hypothetical protein